MATKSVLSQLLRAAEMPKPPPPPSPAILAQRLRHALLDAGPLSQKLYDFELAEGVEFWYDGMVADGDDYFIVISEMEGAVAMLLMGSDKQVYGNEAARARLMDLWADGYAANLEQLLPSIVEDLIEGFVAAIGIRVE
jgi:hypothetical protein